MNHITQMLQQIDPRGPSTADQLLPLIYDDLKMLAAARMAAERDGHTLQATALVHEAYARLVDANGECQWDCRGHFFSAAAEAMRRILIEYALAKKAWKRGGTRQRIELAGLGDGQSVQVDDLLDLNEQTDARKAQVVKLRYFAGLSVAETARCLVVSEATVMRDWRYARAWLRRTMAVTISDLAAE